jgi:integrase
LLAAASPDAPVGEYLSVWLEHAATQVSPDTLYTYEVAVRKHLVPALGSIPLRELKPIHVHLYLMHALKQGRLDGKGGLSRRTVQYHYRILHEAMQFAVDMELLHRNPVAAVDPPVPRRKEQRVLAPEQIRAFLAAIEDAGIYRVPIFLACTTGMRRGEILGLKWENVDLRQGCLVVRQVLKRRAGRFVFEEPKTEKSARMVTLPAAAVDVLKRHKEAQEERRRALRGVYRDYGLVCCRSDGTPIVPSSLTTYFRGWVRRHPEFAGLTFHGLRHTHATMLMAAGVHPKVVSERLGHSSIEITLQLYTHSLPTLQKEAAARIDQIISGGL